jgi:hypothetical protein
MMRPIAAYV